jgi:hypothetical protein
MLINGYTVAEITDASFSTGDIYLGADSLDGDYTEIAFDNLVITSP